MSNFKSTREYLGEFLLYKHNLGYLYDTQSHYLKSYVSFEEVNHPGTLLSKESVDNYFASLADRAGSLYVIVLPEHKNKTT